jgi:hypothetical protein
MHVTHKNTCNGTNAEHGRGYVVFTVPSLVELDGVGGRALASTAGL